MTPTHLLVSVGDERYALRIHEVVEVARLGALTPVPGSPGVVMGVQSLRGQVLPVVDLGALLGSSRPDRRQAMVIVDDSGDRVGLAVDELLDVGPVDAAVRESDAAPLVGSAIVDGALVGVLDVRGVLRLARGVA